YDEEEYDEEENISADENLDQENNDEEQTLPRGEGWERLEPGASEQLMYSPQFTSGFSAPFQQPQFYMQPVYFPHSHPARLIPALPPISTYGLPQPFLSPPPQSPFDINPYPIYSIPRPLRQTFLDTKANTKKSAFRKNVDDLVEDFKTQNSFN